jgi:hypothetical protein
MTENFIPLKCQNCGAGLEIYDDMTRFACSYCKTEMVVERRGGTVALKAVEAAIQKVQVGTDKTAAELAITRYEGELKELRTKEGKLKTHTSSNSFLGFGCGALMLMVGLGALSVSEGAGIAFFASGFLFIGIGFFSRPSRSLGQIQSRIYTLESQIADKKAIADS